MSTLLGSTHHHVLTGKVDIDNRDRISKMAVLSSIYRFRDNGMLENKKTDIICYILE